MSLSVSVIIPAHNAAAYLRQSLEHLARSIRPPDECIVIDDGSTDATAAVARTYGAVVLSLQSRRGPAVARNLAAAQATGDLLFFVDADVCVHPDAITRIMDDFADPGLDAAFGSYDASPASPDLISQYRNLRQCFVHQHARRSACTFWTACGAIRRDVFLAFSGFDHEYEHPSIEDIELGYRLVNAQRTILLDKDILVRHLKRWTFWSLLKTDIFDRGIPWTELILRDRRVPNDLNLRAAERLGTLLAWALPGWAAAAAVAGMPAALWFAGLGAILACLIFLDRAFYRFMARRTGAAGLAAAIFLHTLYHFYCGISFAAALALVAWRSCFARGERLHDKAGSHRADRVRRSHAGEASAGASR